MKKLFNKEQKNIVLIILLSMLSISVAKGADIGLEIDMKLDEHNGLFENTQIGHIGFIAKLNRNWQAGLEVEYVDDVGGIAPVGDVADGITLVGLIAVKRHISLRVALERKYYFSGSYYSALGVASGKAESKSSIGDFKADTNTFHVALGRDITKTSSISLNVKRVLMDYKGVMRDQRDPTTIYNNFIYNPTSGLEGYWPNKNWSTMSSLKIGLLF